MVSRIARATDVSGLVQRAPERVGGRVASADPAGHAFSSEPGGEAARSRQRCGPRALRDDVSFDEQETHRDVELLVGHEHEVIEKRREHADRLDPRTRVQTDGDQQDAVRRDDVGYDAAAAQRGEQDPTAQQAAGREPERR